MKPNAPPISEDAVRTAVRRAVDEALATETRPTETRPTESRPAEPVPSARDDRARDDRDPCANQTIAIGADHGGYGLKASLARYLTDDLGHAIRDCGTDGPTPAADYPAIAHMVARLVATGACRWGIIVDGAGIGSSMAANKVPGVRAALCYDLSSAKNSREHNLANVLTLGSGLVGEGLARQIVQTWLDTPWGEGRHARRVQMITDIEARYLRRNDR